MVRRVSPQLLEKARPSLPRCTQEEELLCHFRPLPYPPPPSGVMEEGDGQHRTVDGESGRRPFLARPLPRR